MSRSGWSPILELWESSMSLTLSTPSKSLGNFKILKNKKHCSSEHFSAVTIGNNRRIWRTVVTTSRQLLNRTRICQLPKSFQLNWAFDQKCGWKIAFFEYFEGNFCAINNFLAMNSIQKLLDCKLLDSKGASASAMSTYFGSQNFESKLWNPNFRI